MVIFLLYYFILGGNKLQTTGSKADEMKAVENIKTTPISTVQMQEAKPDPSADSVTSTALAALQSEVQPVGHDYVEEVILWKLNPDISHSIG